MFFLMLVLCLTSQALLSSAIGVKWPARSISWWYAPDNNWPLMIEQVKAHVDVVTSVMVYCGPEVTDAGTVTTSILDTCLDEQGNGTLPSLLALGVRPELALNSGNCSIAAYRVLWSDTVHSVATMVQLAVQLNASGWNIDLEPQSDNCQGGGTGTAADATLFASWLLALRSELNSAGIRLTVAVADWSPVLSQFETLAPSVDRMLDMSTYNADSLDQWYPIYQPMGNSNVPRSVAGIGLGCWVDSSTNGTWSVTPVSATERISQCLSDGVQELAMFRLLPVTGGNPPSWPEDFWWSALQVYMQGGSGAPWPNPAIGWWYVADDTWPLFIEQIGEHPGLVTSVMLQCGPTVTDGGNITSTVSTECFDGSSNSIIPTLISMGVKPEMWLTGGSGSIEAYRLLWADKVYSISTLVQMAQEYNLSGWNIDLEPSNSLVSDADLYAEWLAVLRPALNAIGVRLTIDVATWAPALAQFQTLAPYVDRLMDMETYNADSLSQWMGYYNSIVSESVNRNAVGVGLGCWVDQSTNGTWSVTPASATQRISQTVSDAIQELAMFRLLPVTGDYPSSWPEDFWWSALEAFMN